MPQLNVLNSVSRLLAFALAEHPYSVGEEGLGFGGPVEEIQRTRHAASPQRLWLKSLHEYIEDFMDFHVLNTSHRSDSPWINLGKYLVLPSLAANLVLKSSMAVGSDNGCTQT